MPGRFADQARSGSCCGTTAPTGRNFAVCASITGWLSGSTAGTSGITRNGSTHQRSLSLAVAADIPRRRRLWRPDQHRRGERHVILPQPPRITTTLGCHSRRSATLTTEFGRTRVDRESSPWDAREELRIKNSHLEQLGIFLKAGRSDLPSRRRPDPGRSARLSPSIRIAARRGCGRCPPAVTSTSTSSKDS